MLERYPRLQELSRHRRKIGAIAAGLVFTFEAGTIFGAAVGSSHQPSAKFSSTAEATPSASATSSDVKTGTKLRIHQLEIIDPASSQGTFYHVQEPIKQANALLAEQTSGKYGVTMGETSFIKVKTDKHETKEQNGEKVSEPCYSLNTLQRANEAYATKHNLGQNDAIFDVLTSTPGCGDYGAVYFGTIEKATPQLAFQPGYAGPGHTDTIMHEIGHAWGLNHETTIGCETKRDDEYLHPYGQAPADKPLAFYEIGDLVNTCGVVKNEGDPKADNDYFSYLTVMGSERPDMFAGRGVYSVPEYNKLDPEDYPIEQVSTRPGTYTLPANRKGLYGISIALPKDHPLRQLDPSLRDITFTLNIPGENDSKDAINTIATGDGESYDINSMSFTDLQSVREAQRVATLGVKGKLSESTEQFQEPIIYLDKTLGIMVTEGRNAETGDPYVRVSSIYTHDSIEKTSFFRQTVEERNELIVSERKPDLKPASISGAMK